MKYVDERGVPVVLQLFEEFARPDVKYKPIFTLPQWKEVYMKHCDVTEYGPAMELLEDWHHWQLVRNHPRLKKIIDTWADEVEVKIRSQAVKQMMKHAVSQNGASAAKWIAEGGFATREKRTKDGRRRDAAIKDEVSAKISDDMKRLGLKVIAGGS